MRNVRLIKQGEQFLLLSGDLKNVYWCANNYNFLCGVKTM